MGLDPRFSSAFLSDTSPSFLPFHAPRSIHAPPPTSSTLDGRPLPTSYRLIPQVPIPPRSPRPYPLVPHSLQSRPFPASHRYPFLRCPSYPVYIPSLSILNSSSILSSLLRCVHINVSSHTVQSSSPNLLHVSLSVPPPSQIQFVGRRHHDFCYL